MTDQAAQLTEDLVTINAQGEETPPLDTALTPEQRAKVFRWIEEREERLRIRREMPGLLL